MITSDGVHAVEQYLLAKYYLTANVYRHRVRLITDQMIVRAIELGYERDNLPELKNLFTYVPGWDFAESYLRWDDARFMLEFGTAHGGTRCGSWLESLRLRRLHKLVFAARVKDFPAAAREPIAALSRTPSAARRRRLECEIAKIIQKRKPLRAGLGPEAVIAHAFTIKSVRETSRNDEAAMMVVGGASPVPFDQESVLFASIDEKMEDSYCEVYAPVEWNSPTERAKVVADVREEVFGCIGRTCQGS